MKTDGQHREASLNEAEAEVIDLFVVYDHPKDYPDNFVVRRFIVDKPTGQCWLYDDLEKARIDLQNQGRICLPRDPYDDPVIVECWL
jgi:hypothetical protein